MEKKVIMNMFICRREFPIGTSNMNPNWVKCVETLRTIKFPTSFGISGASSRGLGVQALLDMDLEESASFCIGLLDKFLPEVPLIVISEVNVKIKNSPIGEWQDDDLVQPGRYFDKLVSEGKTGLVIFDEKTNMLNQTKEYGVFYLKTVFPKGHRLEWLNYLHISKYLTKDLSDELNLLVSDINSKEGIVIPMDKGVDAGCVTEPEIIEDVANEVYNRYCEIFERLTSDNVKDCIRLVWGIGEMENVNYISTHDLPAYPIMIKVGRFLDSSKNPGIYKV